MDGQILLAYFQGQIWGGRGAVSPPWFKFIIFKTHNRGIPHNLIIIFKTHNKGNTYFVPHTTIYGAPIGTRMEINIIVHSGLEYSSSD